MTNPENGVEKPWSESDLLNGIKVGTLIGGCFRASNCTATLLGDFTVKCDSGTHIFIGGLAGYSNKMHGCRAVVQGCLKYSGNVPVVYVGGLEGVVYQEVTNCTSKVKSLVVEGGTIIYAGGLVGGIAYDNPRTTTRVVAGCAAEIEHLLVDRPRRELRRRSDWAQHRGYHLRLLCGGSHRGWRHKPEPSLFRSCGTE